MGGMTRRRRRRKSVVGTLIIAAVNLAALVIGASYLAGRFLVTPQWIDANLLPPLERALGRDITVGGATVDVRGISLAQVVIADDPAHARGADDTLISADGVMLGLNLRALLDRRLLIEQVRLRNPVVTLERNAAGVWDFSTFMATDVPDEDEGPPARESLEIRVEEIHVEHGSVRVRDHEGRSREQGPAVIDLGRLDGTASLATDGAITVTASATLSAGTMPTTPIEVTAGIAPDHEVADIEIDAGRATFGGLDLRDVSANVTVSRDELVIRKAAAELAGGKARVSGKVDTRAAQLAYSGELVLEGVDVPTVIGLFAPERATSLVGNGDATIDFSASGRTREEILASVGIGTVATVPGGQAVVDATVRLKTLDLAHLFRGVPAPDTTEPADPKPEPGPYDTGAIRVKLRLETDTARYEKFFIDDVRADLALAERRVMVHALSARAAGGNLAVEGTLDLDSKGLAYQGHLVLRNGSLETLSSPLPRPPWGEHMGLADLTFSFKGRGMHRGSALAALEADGDATISSGWIRESQLFRKIGESTGIKGFDTLYIKDGGGEIHIHDGLVSTEHVVIGNDKARLVAAGNIGFDGGLDVKLWIGLGPEGQRKLLSRGIFLPYVKDSSGWTNIPVTITGTTKHAETKVVKAAYVDTAAHAVPDSARRLATESKSAATGLIRGSLGALKALVGGRADESKDAGGGGPKDEESSGEPDPDSVRADPD